LNFETNESSLIYISDQKQNIDIFCFSPDGKEIIILLGQNTIRFFNIANGEGIDCECLNITDLIEMRIVWNEKTKIYYKIQNYLSQ